MNRMWRYDVGGAVSWHDICCSTLYRWRVHGETSRPALGTGHTTRMANERLNCWEYQRCGREPGGSRSSHGVCPAATTAALDGANHGSYGGRSCWVVTDTLCGGRTSGAHAEKQCECRKCSFMKRVEVEESLDYISEGALLAMYSDGEPDKAEANL